MNNKKCPHGLDVDPQTGEHIFPKANTYTIKEHDDGKTYTVTEHQGQPKPKQEIDTDKLLAEARSLIEYNKRHKEETKQEPTKTKRELELERSKKQWDEYFRNNPSKIPYKLPNFLIKNEE